MAYDQAGLLKLPVERQAALVKFLSRSCGTRDKKELVQVCCMPHWAQSLHELLGRASLGGERRMTGGVAAATERE
jgi:hypothetical protein